MRPNRVKALWRENKDVRAAWTLTGDLAISLGLAPGAGASDQRFQDACQRVLDSARAHGLIASIAPFSAADARVRVDQGFAFCPFGSDWGFLAEGAEAALREFGPS
jgi:2-keto-3-deoxy-L-rhamnonate aldolase RhmA